MVEVYIYLLIASSTLTARHCVPEGWSRDDILEEETMPTYEYKCKNCGHVFEKFQSITKGPIRKCPKCGKRKLKRLIGSGSGIIFRGSGFYQTDYRSDEYKKASEEDTK